MNLENLKIGIIGHGEIGKSLEAVYHSKVIVPFIRDLVRDDGISDCDYLHVCIPYSTEFISIVSAYMQKNTPKVTIIHSTVPVGTTTDLIRKNPGFSVCHSPIRGLHPNLQEGIITFMIYVGTSDSCLFEKVKKLYDVLGIPKTVNCKKTETTELAKLLDTTYYGICIAYHKEVKSLCDSLEVPFDEVMTEYNRTYNEGYSKLGKSNVVRPVLKDMPGPIGGHCVVPNAELLGRAWKSWVLDLILKYKK